MTNPPTAARKATDRREIMKAAKFSTDLMGRVTVAYDMESWTGEAVRVERVFTCPDDGGYVREKMSNGGWEQVCDKLAVRGSTLSCSSPPSADSTPRVPASTST